MEIFKPHSCRFCQRLVLKFIPIEMQPQSVVTYKQAFLRHFEIAAIFDITRGDVKTAAEKGCRFCSAFLLEVSPKYTARHSELLGTDRDGWVLALGPEGASSKNFYFIDIKTLEARAPLGESEDFDTIWNYHIRSLNVIADLVTSAVVMENTAKYGIRKPINLQPSSQETFALGREWLSMCRAHEDCPKQVPKMMPTRVIKVSKEDNNIHLRLQQSESMKLEPYVALSYCWGGEQTLKTTRATLCERLAQIDCLSLPMSLQDAALVTEKLGITFLWIDSLCIVQDDAEDVANEISRMPSVYGEATVTILASRAASAQEGFLQDRAFPRIFEKWNEWEEIYEIPFEGDDGKRSTVKLVPSLSHYGGGERAPIRTRAWTLQEEMLSPRILEYGAIQTRWLCEETKKFDPHTASCYEDGWRAENQVTEYNLHRSSSGKGIFRQQDFQITKPGVSLLGSSKVRPDNHYNDWIKILDAYLKRGISVITDRLPAISAIAQRYGDLLQDEYLAGLWRSQLPVDLLWSVPMHDALVVRSVDYQGPSWSWAAVKSGVATMVTNNNLEIVIKLVACNVEPLFPTVFDHEWIYGAVKSGELVVTRPLRRATLSRQRLQSGFYRYGLSTPANGKGSKYVLKASAAPDALDDGFVDCSTHTMSVSLLLVLHQLWSREGDGPDNPHRIPYGLMLKKLERNKYSRIGKFALLEKFSKRRKGRRLTLPWKRE